MTNLKSNRNNQCSPIKTRESTDQQDIRISKSAIEDRKDDDETMSLSDLLIIKNVREIISSPIRTRESIDYWKI